MDIVELLFLSAISFSKHIVGIVAHPYQTYRSIAEKGHGGELIFLAIIYSSYFAIASVVKTAAFRPFLLTKQFVLLASGAGMGFLLVVFCMTVLGKILKKTVSLERIAVLWGYTLVPTVCWFLMTSMLYILLPPPRTDSVWGVLFSLFYLTITAVLFFWKAELYYLTLRFGLHLDLYRIILVTIVMVGIFSLYSAGMYTFGIFRIPFL